MESKHLSEYKSELLRGHFLLAIDVAAEVDRARVLNVLKTHRATRVNFFGKWTVEGLSSE